ncbi:MAG: hypothetical protein IJ783_10545 [Kiritimatiellae bacterium]|nr:hypothetical protein [Kiritimatiellia bacterium]
MKIQSAYREGYLHKAVSAVFCGLLCAAAATPAALAEDAYIESDGTQCMNTGYYPSGKTKIEVDFQLTSTAASKDCVFGNYGGSAGFTVLLYANPNNTYFQFCGKDGGWSAAGSGVAIDTARHTVVIDVPARKGAIYSPEGTLQGEAAFGSSWTYNATANWPIALFASSINATGTSVQKNVSAKIYGVKIWESDDGGATYKPLHDYAPAINNGVAGFRDAITGTFLYDTRTSGAGTFAYGGDIPTDDDPYVESDGTSGINTGIVASPGLKVELDYAMSAVEPGAGNDYQQRIFGEDYNDKEPRISLYVNGSGNVAFAAGDGWNAVSTGIKADLKRHKAVIDNVALQHAFMTGVTTNWHAYGSTVADLTKWSTWPLGLFANPTNSTATLFNRQAKAKVFGLKIWQGGTLVRDFAPRSIDGTAGFEDLVTGKFFTCDGLTASASAPTALSGASRDGDAFIESDGTTYSVVDTRYFINPKSKIVLDYQLANFVNSGIVMGGYGSAAGVSTILWCKNSATLVMEMHDGDHGGAADTLLSPTIAPDTKRHTAIFDGPNRHLSLTAPDGTVESEAGFVSSWNLDNTANWPMLLFGSANNPYGTSKQCAKARIFGAKVYEDGVLVHDFTPAVKGDVPGFYDNETGDFFSGGNLVSGGSVMEIADDTPYVESGDSGCYFDTGYYVTSNTCVAVDFMLLRQQAGQQFPFEAGEGNTTGKSFMRTYGNGNTGTGNFAYALGTDTYISMDVPYSPMVRSEITLDAYNLKAKVVKNGKTIREMNTAAGGRQPDKSSSTLKLLSNGAGTANWCKARLYGVKIYEEGTLVRDYVPICQAGTYALRDTVNGTVLAKASSSAAFTGRTANGDLDDAFFNAEMRAEDAYIESDGTQGINLGYYTTPNTRYEIDYQLKNTTAQIRPFGEADTSAQSLHAELYIQGNGNVAFGVGDTWKAQETGKAADLVRHVAVLDFANRECGYSGYKMFAFDSARTCKNTAVVPMWLFAKGTSAAGAYGNRASMKLHAFRIFESGTLVHEYLPYKVGDTVGLYDTMTGDVVGNTVSGASAFTYGGGLGYGKFAGALTDLVVAPEDALVGVNATRILTAYAPGATSYIWTRNGEELDGVTGTDCTVAWERPSVAGTAVYAVTPVFTKGGETIYGASSSAEVTMAPAAFVMVIR